VNSPRNHDLLLSFWCYDTVSRTCTAWWCYLDALAITAMALYTNHHNPLSHCHESCSLTCSTFLRFCARTWFWTLACSACTYSIVFDCLKSSQKYLFCAIYWIFEVHINFYRQILSLINFFLGALALSMERSSK
jgi:hypothetical protein